MNRNTKYSIAAATTILELHESIDFVKRIQAFLRIATLYHRPRLHGLS
jgi:hypothetical protein